MHEDGHTVTHKQINEFLKNQRVNQIMRPIALPNKYNSVLAEYPKQNYQIDIVIYDRFTYHNYQYILMIVDVYSRFAIAKAMTNRNKETIKKMLDESFNEIGFPEIINSDQEFNCHLLNDYFNQHNIVMNYSQTNEVNKQAIVERLNKTIAGLLAKWRIATGLYAWNKVLPEIMLNYNSSYHRTIKAKPVNVFNGIELNNQVENYVENSFKLGDKVRKLKREIGTIFIKSDAQKYSKKIYTITNFKDKNKMYISVGGVELKNYFKPYELIKVDKVEDYVKPVETKHEVEENQEAIHKEIQKEKKHDKILKQVGMNKESIIADKVPRIKKISNKYKDYT